MNTKIWRYSYFLITALFIFSFAINWFGWQFSGYWTEKVIAWVWLFCSLIILIIKFSLKNLKYYLIGVASIVGITLLSMGFVPIGFIIYVLPESGHQDIQINKDYRLQVGDRIMTTLMIIYEEHGMFEKVAYRMNYKELLHQFFDSYDDNTKITIQKATFNHLDNDKLFIDYQILNQSKTVYHYHSVDGDKIAIAKK